MQNATLSPAGGGTLVLAGAGFGAGDYTAVARAGGTAFEATAWASGGEVRCMNVLGVFGTLRVAVTAGGRGGTLSEVPNPQPSNHNSQP